MKETISIIVPVYNVEAYLTQCLDSLINQTYKNIEIICVNDGSSDNSLQILRRFSLKDPRVNIVNKINQGVSKARNEALKIASGAFLMFVDADDWIEIDTCEKAIRAMKNNNADIVMWSYIRENGLNSSRKIIFPTEYVFNEEEVHKRIHRRFIGLLDEELKSPEFADSLCPVWGKLYKRDLIIKSGVSFIDLMEIGTYEDGMFNLEVFYCAKTVVYLNEHLYHYRRANTFSITSRYREQLFEQWQNLFQQMQDYIKKNQLSNDYVIALYNRIALSILGLGLNIVSSNYTVLKKIGMIQKILSDERYREAYKRLKYKYFPIHWKIFYKCAKWRCAFIEYILLIIIKKIIWR